MKKLVIFGANGRTGRILVEQALERGLAVTAAVRDPAVFAAFGNTLSYTDNLHVVEVDVLRAGSASAAMAGQDAAISAIGAGRKPHGLYSRGVQTIVDAMTAAGVQRFICISSSAVKRDDPNLGFLYGKIISPFFMTELYTDIAAMEQIVESSSLDWTLVRPPYLTNSRGTGHWRIQDASNPKGGARLSRFDLAAFILDQLGSGEWSRRRPTIAW